jgi:hypothetical protein
MFHLKEYRTEFYVIWHWVSKLNFGDSVEFASVSVNKTEIKISPIFFSKRLIVKII